MESLGYATCKANPDLWLKPKIEPEHVVQYDSYLLHYVDVILHIHHNADAVLKQLNQLFPLKLGFFSPDMYLGAKLHNTRLHNEAWACAMSSVQ